MQGGAADVVNAAMVDLYRCAPTRRVRVCVCMFARPLVRSSVRLHFGGGRRMVGADPLFGAQRCAAARDGMAHSPASARRGADGGRCASVCVPEPATTHSTALPPARSESPSGPVIALAAADAATHARKPANAEARTRHGCAGSGGERGRGAAASEVDHVPASPGTLYVLVGRRSRSGGARERAAPVAPSWPASPGALMMPVLL